MKREADKIPPIPVLTYHKIDPRPEIGITSVAPKYFQKQMEFLYQNGYRPITFKDLLAQSELPDKPVILCFDDGYTCVHRNALPVLNKFGFRAVVFIISGFVGLKNSWDANLGGIKFCHLNETQIQELVDCDWEIGSHGVNHLALPYLNSRKLNLELRDSKIYLEQLTRKPIVSLAYPFGFFNRRVQIHAARAGYTFGCTNFSIRKYPENNLQIPRLPVYRNDSQYRFGQLLNGDRGEVWNRIRISVLSWPAVFTPIYQNLFKRHLFLEN